MREIAKGRKYSPVGIQLGLAAAAIHTSSDLMCHLISNPCRLPESIERLRDEAKSVLAEHGWSKSLLFHLKLMDSVLKETLRITPPSMVMFCF